MSISLAAIAIRAAAERAARHAADPGAAAAESAAARQELALHPHSVSFHPTLARLIAREIAQIPHQEANPINWGARAPAYFMLFVDHPVRVSYAALADEAAVTATLASLPNSVREELSSLRRRRPSQAHVIASISLHGAAYCFVHSVTAPSDSDSDSD